MQYAIDYATLAGALDAVEFAMDECNNRILEAQEAGDARTEKAWRLIKQKYQKTFDQLNSFN